MRVSAATVIAFAIMAMAPGHGFAESTDAFKALEKELGAVKDALKNLQQDVQEMKTLLRARQGAQGHELQNVVLSTGDAPFKGDKNAKIVLVDFTDYQ